MTALGTSRRALFALRRLAPPRSAQPLHCQAATDVEVAVGLPAHDDDLVVRLAAETNHAAKAHVIHRTPTGPA